jgi:hypothetical protein
MNILLIGGLVSEGTGYTILGVGVFVILVVRLFEFRYFLHGSDPVFKRKYFWWSTVIGLMIGILLAAVALPLREAISCTVALAIATYLSHRNTRICDACGKLNRDFPFWGAPLYCNKCGAKLNQRVTV